MMNLPHHLNKWMNFGKKARLFLLQEFPNKDDEVPINKTMRDANTMCVSIVHINPRSNDRYRIVGSAVFKPLFEPPFGSYISYVATNSEMKGVGLGQQFESKLLNRQMKCHGIGRNLMNLV